MAPETGIATDAAEASELVLVTAEILSEAGELACPSLTGLLEALIDRGADRPGEARA